MEADSQTMKNISRRKSKGGPTKEKRGMQMVNKRPITKERPKLSLIKADFMEGKTSDDLLFMSEAQEMTELQEAFSAACRDGDTFVSSHALSVIMRQLVQDTPLPVGAYLSDIEMHFDEFMSYHATEYGHADRWKEAKQNEKIMIEEAAQAFDDKMFYTVDELRASLPRLDPTLTQEELDAMCAEADGDGNGDIDYDEFVHMLN